MTDPRGISSGLVRTLVPVRTRILALTLAVAVTAWIAACSGGDGGGSTPTDNNEITSVQIEPGQVTLSEVGQTTQLVATARTASGGTDASASFQWSSSNTSVATVNQSGLVTARGRGSATVSARTGGVEGTVPVAVNISVATVQVTPDSHSFDALGATVQLEAQALSAGGNAIPGVTATWNSSASGVARVNASGLVTAEDNGTATITATIEGVQGSASVEVDQVVESVQVSPTEASTAVGGQVQFEAQAFDPNSVFVNGASFTWSSSDESVATVNASGLATAVAQGSTTLSATSEGVTGQATLNVTPAVASVEVTPEAAEASALGQTVQFSAVARDDNGDVIDDVTFTWTSDNSGVATVDGAGLATAVANGTATITATVDGVSDGGTLTVAQTVTAVQVAPSEASTTVGQTVQFSATALDANGNEVAGSSFMWTSSNEAVATVDQNGLASAVAAGQATITATSSGVQGSATLTVDEAGSGSIRMISGNNQNGKTQLDFGQPLVVEVLDASDNPAPGVTVTWTVTQGDATLSSTSVQTDGQGRAQVTLTAGTQLVDHQIQASADGRDGSPVTFSARTTVLQVFIQDNAFVDLQGRTNQNFSVTVAVGDTIEWLYQAGEASVHTVTSTSEPSGGAAFDSGNMSPGDTFRFVPGTTGTWQYFCRIHPNVMLNSEIVVN